MRLVRLLDLPAAAAKLDWLVWRERDELVGVVVPPPPPPPPPPTTTICLINCCEPLRFEVEEKAGALKLFGGFLRLLLQVVSLTTAAGCLCWPEAAAGRFVCFSSCCISPCFHGSLWNFVKLTRLLGAPRELQAAWLTSLTNLNNCCQNNLSLAANSCRLDKQVNIDSHSHKLKFTRSECVCFTVDWLTG